MNWIADFEKIFEIKEINNMNSFKIIIGTKRYLQKIGSDMLTVEKTSALNKIYNEFEEVGFLVNKWLKIQDSLEMIFNLLTGNNIKALKMLAYLRENKISSIEFANYLYNNRKLLLVNNYTSCNKSNHNIIIKLIETLEGNSISILFVGNNNSAKKINKDINKEIRLGIVIHSSGVNLNNDPKKYKSTWIDLNNCYVSKINNFTSIKLNEFKVL